MSPERLSARELTARLVAHEVAAVDAPDAAPAAVHAACERVYRELSRWLGASGCRALFSRALTQAQGEHPVLMVVQLDVGFDGTQPALRGVSDLVDTHEPRAVTAALESLLATLIELLGRLIGDDMVVRLLDGRARDIAPDDESVRMRTERGGSEQP